LTDSVCETILSTCHRGRFSPNETIYRAGEPKEAIFLLAVGRVKVSQVSKKGKEVLLWLNLPGQVIGSLNLVADGVHSSTARAVQSCKVLIWNLPAFEANVERFPVLLRNVQHIIDRQLVELQCRVCEISSGTVWLRLAHELIRLTDQIGRSVNGCFEIDLTQEALAQMTAMTSYSVNRQLSDWERRGLVGRRKCTIIIRDLLALKRVCRSLII
jgi:CRP-like cAMP-binding protein